tara:strand:+ start:150 stop:1136 length:987 start_codon:yes stop_codon:yes gene_type:complete
MDMKQLIIGGQRILDGAEDRWSFDRTKYLNSSEADNCIRQLWYAKHGTPEEPQEWGYAWRGRMAEEYVVRALNARNDCDLDAVGAGQMSWQDEKRKLSATPDGEYSFEEGPWRGLEVKSIDPRTNRNNLPKPAHITQFRIAMALRNQRRDLPPLEKGDLLYIDASNYNDIISFEVDVATPAMLDQYAKKAQRVFRTKSADVLDREGKKTGDCKYCPFKAACGVVLDDTVSGRQRVRRGSNLDAAAREYVEIKDAQDAGDARLKVLREDIISGLDSRPKVIVGNIEVTLAAAKGRETLDKKAVAAAGIDLSPYTKVGAPSSRLNVKRIS